MSTPAPLDVVNAGPAEAVAQVLSFMKAHENNRGSAAASSFYLSGAEEHDRVKLSEPVQSILKQVLAALSEGQSISIVTRDREISTQQAAELLGLSRPTVVRLIDSGELPAQIPGTERRKLKLADVLAYRDKLRQRRDRFIAESSAAYEDADPDEAAAMLAEARKRPS